MRLLLDTHAFLWWWAGDRKIGAKIRSTIGGANTVLVSAVSAWEMTIKMSLGKLRFDGGIADAVEACGFERLDMRFEHAEAVRSLPSHHSDPFDRLLIAQVIVEGATFVTHDRSIANYLIPTLWI
ncbi:MAG TPA: type II toxin-antitoxin system VapC family toxin [Polyangia bacterium]